MADEVKDGNGGLKEVKEEKLEVGWQVSPQGVMIVTVSLQDVALAVYTLDKARIHIHDIVKHGDKQKEIQRKELSGVTQGAKQNPSFFKKHFSKK